MFVERVYADGDSFTAVKFGGVETKAGDGNLFRHGMRLSEQTEAHLPGGGYFAHLPKEIGAIVCRVPTKPFDLEPWHLLDAMHRALCATYGGQDLELEDHNGQPMVWRPLVDIGGKDFVGAPQFAPVEDNELSVVAA